MTVLTGGVHLPLVSICFLYALVFPYIFSLNSEEITLCYDSVDWGVHLPFLSMCFLYALVFPYIFSLNSEAITLCSDSVAGGSISLWCLNDTIEQ